MVSMLVVDEDEDEDDVTVSGTGDADDVEWSATAWDVDCDTAAVSVLSRHTDRQTDRQTDRHTAVDLTRYTLWLWVVKYDWYWNIE